MIEAIIFDVGGVYLQGNFYDFINKSYEVLGMLKRKHTDGQKVVFDQDFNVGKTTAKECFEKMFGTTLSDDLMQKISRFWTSTWTLQPDMEDLVRRLKEHNYTLAILSNSDPVNSPNYEKKGWYAPFKHVVLSHKEGILKPDKRIYEILLEKLQISAKNCVMIDDQQACLTPAAELGMQVILYESVPQLEKELNKLSVKL